MNQGTWVLPLRHRNDRDPGPAPQGHNRGSASRLTRGGVLLVGALGVLLAFAGSAAAGSLITGKQIKDDTITSVDLRDGRLKGVDVRDGNLTRTDFGKLPAGDEGPQGGPGLPGPDGVQGVTLREQTRNLLAGESNGIDVDCPTGTHVVGGGLSSDQPQDLYIFSSHPTFHDSWSVLAEDIGGGVITVTAKAVCAH